MKVTTERIQEIEDKSMIDKYYDSLTAKEFIWEYLDDHKKECFDRGCEIERVLDDVLRRL